MSLAPVRVLPTPPPDRGDARDEELGRLLGLYHGYDAARLELARLVARFGSERPDPGLQLRRGREQAARAGFAGPPPDARGLPRADFAELDSAELDFAKGDFVEGDFSDGAHAAVLAAFAIVSDKAEAVLAELCERWPELRAELGGPLPSEHVAWREQAP